MEWLVSVALAGAALLAYWPVWKCGFVNFDDPDYVLLNPHVREGLSWAGLAWALTSHAAANWHPLTWLSLMLDCQLHGPNPVWLHLTSLALHVANIVLLFLLLQRMTGRLWPSAVVAAFFGLHPLHVESVAWIAERKDTLSVFFALAATWCYVRYAQAASAGRSGAGSPRSRSSLGYYLLAGVLFPLALMAKPMVVTFPLVWLLLDFWPLGRFPKASPATGPSREAPGFVRLVVEKIPFLVLSAVVCVIVLWAQSKGGAVVPLAKVPFVPRAENALVSYVVYLWKTVWPTGLSPFYPQPTGPMLWPAIAAGIFLAGISWLVVKSISRRPYLLVGWLWFLGMLVPVIGLVKVGEHARADRYTYMPMVGILIGVAWGAAEVAGRSSLRRAAVCYGTVAALVLCAGATFVQVRYWKDGWTLFEHALEVNPNNTLAHNNLGVLLLHQGQVPEAIVHFRKALEVEPDYAFAHYNLGNALQQDGRLDEAIFHYEKALEHEPDYAKAYNNLGNALAKAGRLDDAVRHYQRALALQPDDADTHNNLANVLVKRAQGPEAIVHYRAALELRPDLVPACNSLAWLLATSPQASLRNGARAVELARRAEELSGGNNPLFLATLAASYAEAGSFPDAVATAQRAVDLALQHHNAALAARNRELLELFRSGRPYREQN